MRKITKNSIQALIAGNHLCKDNTLVTEDTLFLHGNPIIQVREDGVYIQTAGWNSITTKERLNGLPGVTVYTRKGQLFLNGEPWDGSWKKVDVGML